ncbi:DUF2252 family protein [Rugamonas sp.]|uniref:DUF2252 family protein n=1 Tax=Rugamonas sp. TaxID=1926287 RepID=UPI0025DE7E9F|nr:DUF2252 family protein [Rugamonas sp.]
MNLPPPDARRALLLQRRSAKMARSPHAYVRGNTAQYYDWLHTQRGQALPRGPAIWICGDCHLGNLGPVADAAGDISLQLRDFDQTTIGNPAHDLVRLGLSLATAARGSSLPGVVTAQMLQHMLLGYQRAFYPGHDGLVAKPHLVKQSLRTAGRRSWKALARERLVDVEPTIPLGKNFWPLSADERHGLAEMFAAPEMRALVTTLKSRDPDADLKVLDAAYWVKGCSSLGLLRYAVLLDVGDDRHCLIDIKEAVGAASPRYPRVSMPRDNARRVLEGARRLTPALGERMLSQRFMDRGVFVRELLPQDLKLEIDQLSLEQATRTASYLAYVVGQAHASQMDADIRNEWLQELMFNPGKAGGTPQWLWDSVVQLVGSHESGYLEHCRRYAQTLD